jgi:hypothetical protein
LPKWAHSDVFLTSIKLPEDGEHKVKLILNRTANFFHGISQERDPSPPTVVHREVDKIIINHEKVKKKALMLKNSRKK